MTLSPGTQLLLDTALASHADAVAAGEDEASKSAAAALAAMADDQAKALALSKAQQANSDLMAFVTQIQLDLAVVIPPAPPA